MSDNISDGFDQLTQEALSVSELDRCYATLGLNNSASIEQVKERCKELIKQWHPDQFKDDPARHQVAVEKFAAFKKAYDTISSTENSPNAAAVSSASSEQPQTKQPAEEPKQSSINSVNESVYAEFWRRVVARLLDLLIIVLPSLLIKSAGAEALTTLVFMAYCVVMESSKKQATLGKMAVGIKVVDVQGNRLSIGRAVGRHLGNLLNALTFGIGYDVAAFSKRGQALHDMVSGCYVVNKAATPSEVVSCTTKPRFSAASILLFIFIALPLPLGVLAAIAIPQFTAYKKKTEQASANNSVDENSTYVSRHQIGSNSGSEVEKAGDIFDKVAREGAVPKFEKNGFEVADYVIIDKSTGLMWARNLNFGNNSVSWNEANKMIKSSSLCGYVNWRLPTYNELHDMLTRNKNVLDSFSYLQQVGFINTEPKLFWSITASNDEPENMMVSGADMNMNLPKGFELTSIKKTDKAYVWPVRDTK